MADSNSLRQEAADLRARAEAKSRDAENARFRSVSYSQGDDYNRASYASSEADKLSSEAADLQLQAQQKESEAATIDSQISDLDRQELDIQANCKAQIDALEAKKRSLRGPQPPF